MNDFETATFEVQETIQNFNDQYDVHMIIISKELLLANKYLFDPVQNIIMFKDIESSEECIEISKYLASNGKIRIFYNQTTKIIAKDISKLLKTNDLNVPEYIKSDI